MNINRVILTGNLTRDPEVRSTSGGTSVCTLRLAVNTRRKNSMGDWEDKPNYFNVTVWGRQAENCAQYLSKGRPVAIDGRLDWREYTDKEGNNRQAVDVVAENIQFLGGRDDSSSSSMSDLPVDTSDLPAVPAAATTQQAALDDDIPF